jgi:hypothetical protein
MVIACLALFAAIGGGAYAATKVNTEDLKREAVTGPKIAKRTIKGNKVANDTLKGNKIREETLGTVPNADTVDGKHAECEGGTQLFAGDCWETAARAPANWPTANQTCTAAGGTLPPTGALKAASQSGFTLGGTDEWADDVGDVAGLESYEAVTVSAAGGVNFTNPNADAKNYRCVFPLVN